MKTILVIAAHPDDELLGCGGTLIKHVVEGNQVYCLILGEGMTSRSEYEKKELSQLHKDARKAGEIIGFKESFFANLPDNKFDSVALLDVVKIVEEKVQQIKPDIVYTHHPGDVNVDHEVTFEAVMTACRPCNKNCPKELYTFETLSSTEWQLQKDKIFKPNTFVNIEPYLERKIEAMKAYQTEIKMFPHSRSEKGIRILAGFRGMQASLKRAEGLCLVRKIS